MKTAAIIATAFVLSAPVALAQDKPQTMEPVIWGASSGNTACVIFAEGHKTSGRFYGIAATAKRVGKLTLIETQNYTFPDKEVLETQENLDKLMEIAHKDRVKFVKIPEKYSPELLEKARSACRADAQ